MNIPLVTGPEFMDSITGRTISGGNVTDDGVHFFLDDGRVVIMTGAFLVFVGNLEKRTLQ